MSSLKKFDSRFGELPGESDETGGVEQEPDEVINDGFSRRFGWFYSAAEVAEYERITLEQAYNLGVVQFLNDMIYLRALGEHRLEQSKKYAGNTNG